MSLPSFPDLCAQSLAQCYNSAGLPVAAELTLRYSAAVAGKTG